MNRKNRKRKAFTIVELLVVVLIISMLAAFVAPKLFTGIGRTKAHFMDLEHDPIALDVMRKLKRTLDPNNILNPGKLAL